LPRTSVLGFLIAPFRGLQSPLVAHFRQSNSLLKAALVSVAGPKSKFPVKYLDVRLSI
jgi:hypothetical protein